VRIGYDGIDGVCVWRWPVDVEVRARIVESEPTLSPERAGAVDAAWARHQSANPRLYDGEILSVVRMDPGHDIVCRRSRYKHLTVEPEVETGTDQLSVTAVVVGRDRRGRDTVLLGRRGAQTRIYGGMWELGPSGGVDPPPPLQTTFGEAELHEAILREVAEELGGRIRVRPLRVCAVTHDPRARSYDLVMVCVCNEPTPHLRMDETTDWEYQTARWVRTADLPRFDEVNAPSIIGPTRALFRFFGWV
jgi:8-oxo-dGTP pyrophosphatase MutT (NUDIX family)